MNLLTFLLLCALSVTGFSQVTRVAGNYKVSGIKSLKGGQVQIDFTAVNPTGSFDRLTLVSDHVHMGIKSKDTLRLSAEVVEPKPKGVSPVSQVLVFLPSRQGSTPVWLLSRRHPPKGLSGAKLLEMHAPSADFQIF